MIVFQISDPFLYSVDTNELGFFAINALFNTTIEYLSGSRPAKPSLYIAFGNVETVNQVEITIGGKLLQINQAIKAGDILSISGEKLDVALNGKRGIDRVGEFGELAIGKSSVQVKINGTFEAEIFIQYADTYV